MKTQFFASVLALSQAVVAAPLVIERAPGNTTVGISEALLSDFEYFANVTAAAYCPNNENATASTLVTCPGGVCPLIEANAATILASFGGPGDTSIANIKGFVALDSTRSEILVAFAGSGQTVRNWLADFTFIQVAYTLAGCKSCTVHSGFATGWNERRVVVLAAVNAALAAHPDFKVVLTGHSIGGAVATLAAAEMRSTGIVADTFTFGSPPVGNPALASFVSAQAGSNNRMTHVNDPIPQIPPPWLGFQHTSPEYWLSTGDATTEVYTANEVVVCEGLGNADCNLGTGLIPIAGDAHNHYLGPITACQGPVAW